MPLAEVTESIYSALVSSSYYFILIKSPISHRLWGFFEGHSWSL